MSQSGFDQDRADSLVQALGEAIVNDPAFTERDWSGIALVFELDGAKGEFGYIYAGESEWEAATPEGWDTLDIAEALRDAMTIPGKAPWKKCLVQINRNTGGIEIDFDYEGMNWTPDPAQPERLANSLRP